VSFEGAARVAAVKQPRRNLELKAVNRAPNVRSRSAKASGRRIKENWSKRTPISESLRVG